MEPFDTAGVDSIVPLSGLELPLLSACPVVQREDRARFII